MRFGLYAHIPYCLQKCHYCDFVTYEMNHKLGPAEYVQLLCKEIQARAKSIPYRTLNSLYLGGGTPSVLPPEKILSIRDAIANEGFNIAGDVEVTIEINPGTVTKQKLDLYLAAGVNRFSVGVQTFNAKYLGATGRLHSVSDSRELLELLALRGLNFSFDLLFGLPNQTLKDLEADLIELVKYRPPHVSLYNLTVPNAHAMNAGRASDDEQAEMFSLIDSYLSAAGIKRYEISNFAQPGFESKHNSLYWSDLPYWGVGVGAHSYLPSAGGDFGVRFWNPAKSDTWMSQIETLKTVPFFQDLPGGQIEHLARHESLTDFCHTSLRKLAGLDPKKLSQKFGAAASTTAENRLRKLVDKKLVDLREGKYVLAPASYARANLVFLELTFLKDDLPPLTSF